MEPTIESRIESILAHEEEPSTPPDEGSIEEPAQDEQSTQEAQPEVEESQEAESETANDEDDGIELSTIAETLGLDTDKLDVDEDGSLVIKTKIDGIEGKAKLNDLIVSYQKQGHLDKTTKEVTELKKSLEQQRNEYDQKVDARLTELNTLAEALVSDFNRDYDQVPWQELRNEDPAEYAAKFAEYQQRQSQLAQLVKQVRDKAQEQEQARTTKMQELAQKGAQSLREMIPEWGDYKVFEKESKEIETYALTQGFSPQEYEAIVDPRAIVILRDAMRYREQQKATPVITQKVRKAPKIVKPGSTQTVQVNQTDQLRAKIKKSGGKDGVTDYLMAKGIV